MTVKGIKSVTVVGLGYVGLPTAALLARAGYDVLGVDVNAEKVAMLQSGDCPLGEPDVSALVQQALESGHLHAATDARAADVFIICVPTPINADKTANLSMVKAAIEATARVVEPGSLIILESTSPIGTTRNVIGGALREAGLDPERDVDVCYCPERVYPGATVQEILKNDRVVGGLTPVAAQRAKAFYNSFCEGVPIATSAEAAEYSKLMENTFRDVNIALANVFARVGEERGIDVRDVIALANRHPRVNVHAPGPGVGGHCIPVDPWFLIEAAPEVTELLLVARGVNDTQPNRLLARAMNAGLEQGARVAVLGAAYRGDIDDARESPTALLADLLREEGFEFRLHDPFVKELETHAGEVLRVTADLDEALREADALFVMTDHSAYRALPPERVEGMRGRLIVDGRRVLHAMAFAEAGFNVIATGLPEKRAGDVERSEA